MEIIYGNSPATVPEPRRWASGTRARASCSTFSKTALQGGLGAKPASPCTPAGAQMGPSNSHTSGVHIYIIYIYIYSFFSCKSRNHHGPVYPTVMGRSTPDSSKLASEQTCLTCLHISEARACTTRGGFTSLSEVKQAESCITAW